MKNKNVKSTARNIFHGFMFTSGVAFWALFSYGFFKGCVEEALKPEEKEIQEMLS